MSLYRGKVFNLRRAHDTPWLVFNTTDWEKIKLPRPRSLDTDNEQWATDGTKYPVEPARDIDWFSRKEPYAPYYPKVDRWGFTAEQEAVAGNGDPQDDIEQSSSWTL